MFDLYYGLRAATKEIYNTIYHEELPDQNLDQFIKQSGYEGIHNAHERTLDLLDLFARNLKNSGARGMLPDDFGRLIRGASEQFINNNAFHSITLSEFVSAVQNALNERQQPEHAQHAQVGQYYNWIVDPQEPPPGWVYQLSRKPSIVKDIESTFQFIEFLSKYYDGNAQTYTNQLADSFAHQGQACAVQRAIGELIQIPGIGIALASNFLKDSHIDLVCNLNTAEMANHYAASFVKPDRHVLRLMHLITRRYSFDDRDALLTETEDELAKEYHRRTTRDPNEIWPAINFNDFAFGGSSNLGRWKCIKDVLFWANEVQVSPFEIDRLLYFCGSAKFGLADLPTEYDARNTREERYDILQRYLNF